MELSEFFRVNPKVALAFSGGVDSAYLLYAALQNGANVHAYYVKSAFQPRFELTDAQRLATQLKADMTVLNLDVLACPQIRENPPDRCYYCKKLLFGRITDRAVADGYTTLIDGTNASDDVADRPGVRALHELSVRSPLRECGLTKDEIRRLSREAGLFTWNKPTYACLATRISTHEAITQEKLERTERAEDFLFSLGFTDFRVRSVQDNARIQVPSSQLAMVLEKKDQILRKLKKFYASVSLDLEGRDE